MTPARLRPWNRLFHYLIVKYQDLAPMFLAASVATLTVFLPFVSFGEL